MGPLPTKVLSIRSFGSLFHKEAHFHLSEHSKNHNILATTNSCTIASLMWWLLLTVLVYYIMCKGISSVIYLQRQDNSLQFAEVFPFINVQMCLQSFPCHQFLLYSILYSNVYYKNFFISHITAPHIHNMNIFHNMMSHILRTCNNEGVGKQVITMNYMWLKLYIL